MTVAQIIRQHSISETAADRFHNWKSKYGGMQVTDVKRKTLNRAAGAQENRRLKKMYAELSLENEVSREVLPKK